MRKTTLRPRHGGPDRSPPPKNASSSAHGPRLSGKWSRAGDAGTVRRCDDVRVDVVSRNEVGGAVEICRASAKRTHGPYEPPSGKTFTEPAEKVR